MVWFDLKSLVRVVLFNSYIYKGCVFGRGEIPVPIPNTEVKSSSGDGTAALVVGE